MPIHYAPILLILDNYKHIEWQHMHYVHRIIKGHNFLEISSHQNYCTCKYAHLYYCLYQLKRCHEILFSGLRVQMTNCFSKTCIVYLILVSILSSTWGGSLIAKTLKSKGANFLKKKKKLDFPGNIVSLKHVPTKFQEILCSSLSGVALTIHYHFLLLRMTR